MSFFDTAAPVASSATPSAGAISTSSTQPAIAPSGFFSKTNTPVSTTSSTSTIQSKSGFFDSVATSPISKFISGNNENGQPTPSPSPYWEGADHQGNTFGPSKTIDPSGRPLLDYKRITDESTTTDKTRTDTPFNPMVAAPQKQTDIATPRVVTSSEKAQIKENVGAPKSDVIDHAMALTVAGSNEPENLRPEPNDVNSKQGTFETDLDKQVREGKISLFDAQKLEAANKGLPTPFTGTQAPSFWDNVKGYLDKAYTVAGDETHAIEDTAASVGNKLSYGMGILGSWLANAVTTTDNVTGKTTHPFDPTVSKAIFSSLPSAVAENLPFVGSIVKQIEQDPINTANLNIKDILSSLVPAGKEFISSMIGTPALTLEGAILGPLMQKLGENPGQIDVNVPGLGEVSSAQYQAAQKINEGKPLWKVLTEAVPDSIFDTLAVVGLAGEFVKPQEVMIMQGESPEGLQAKETPQSFREYKPPISKTPIPNDIFQKIVQEKGIDLSNTKYDPEYPTFFRLAGDTNATMVSPSIVQIQPSILDSFFSKYGGDINKVPSNQIVPIYSQDVKLTDVIDKANEVYQKNSTDVSTPQESLPSEPKESKITNEVSQEGKISQAKTGTRYYPLGRGPMIDVEKIPELLKDIAPRENIKYTFNPDLLKENNALGTFEHNPRMEALNPALKPIIDLYTKGGKAYVKPAFHEAYHYLENKVFSPELLAQLNKETLAKMNEGDHLHYKTYGTDNERASEYRADEFAKEQAEKAGYKSPIRKILDKVRAFIQKIIDIGSSIKSHLASIPNKQGGFIDLGFGEKASPSEEEFEHISSLISDEHATDVDAIDQRSQELGMRQEALKNNPASKLSKYANKRTGELPEVLGKGSTKFGRKGDDIVSELGFTDSEQAREAYNKYRTDKKSFESDLEKLKDDKKALIQALKESDAKNTQEYEARFDPEITEANKGVVPPQVRGGIHAPEMVLKNFKDKGALTLGRDTLERNIEKVVPKSDQPELKKFLIDPVRTNETDRVRFSNDLRKEIAGKMKELGIKRSSKEDQLTQRFGEGMMTKEDLVKALPDTWKQVESAADYFRKTYDELIDKWNDARARFNYKPVGKHDNYFRHFQEINQFTNSFGFLRSESQLPTEIAGKTADFKPGKQFTTAELARTGHKTSYTAIGGMDNYLDSVTKQMYHIDSIQRGRALEKYIRQVAKKSYDLTLPNFVSNVQEWTNLVAGKAAMLDRAIESTVGRPIMKFMNGMSNLIARNIIGGNISVALTHLVSTPLELATTDKVPLIQGLMSTLVSPLKSEPITHIDGQESSFLTRRFPLKSIQPTKFDSATDTLNWLFKITDEFKSKLTVSGKYYEGLKDGLSKEDSMKSADEYAGRIIGDYSIGNRPNLMNTHTTKLLAQFQLGVNDGLSVLMHDIPHWEEGNKAKIAYRLVAFAIFSYLFNQVYKQIRGSGKGLDPIDLGLTITGLNDEGSGQDILSRLKLAESDLAGELPFTSIAAGSFPLATAFGQPLYNLITGAGPRGAAAETLASNLISPVGGGGQAVKTVKGIEAVNQGKTVTSKGTTNTVVEPSVGNYVKGAIFGPSAFNNANGANHDTTNLINLLNAGKGQATVEAEAMYNKMKNSPDASSQFQILMQNNPALAKNVETVASDDKSGITLNERLVKSLGVVDGSRAKYIANQINSLPDQKSKEALWNRYIEIKIISPQVADQLSKLIKK